MAKKIASPLPPLVTRLSIEGLFGRYSYDIEPPAKSEIGYSQTVLLYGANGCGKTTILSLLYSLLSTKRGRGLKSAVLKVPFQRFRVDLASGHVVEAVRKGDDLLGNYWLHIQTPSGQHDSALCGNETEDGVRGTDELLHVISLMRDMDLELVYLSDYRQLMVSSERPTQWEAMARVRRRVPRSDDDEVKDPRQLALDIAASRFHQWALGEALARTNASDVSVHAIYEELIRTLPASPVLTRDPDDQERESVKYSLLEEIKAIEKEAQTYGKMGLTAPFKSKVMAAAIHAAPNHAVPIISTVLRPYLQATKERLSKLGVLHSLVLRFVHDLNDFFRHKEVSFSLQDGVGMQLDQGRGALALQHLSSGEKQLLLLFCNLIASRSGNSIVIIDEPELSLNPRWQRRLIGSMAGLIEGTPTQIVLATHSTEILSLHRQERILLSDDRDPSDNG